jgi:hypothetical protein
MQQIHLGAVGAARQTTLTREGGMLHVVNDPLLVLQRVGESAATYRDRLTGGPVLVGFDRTPTIDSFDAVVPAFHEACFAVPSSVGRVILSFAYLSFTGSGATTTLQLLVEWLDCVEPFMRPIQSPLLANGTRIYASDANFNMWPQIPATPVLDQQLALSMFAPFLRPHIAPSSVDTIHQVTAANTLFSFLGARNLLTNGAHADNRDPAFNVVHRIIVSVSVACLFVIGGPDLTVGSPGVDELGRLAFSAAGIQTLEYGEGLLTQAISAGGPWKAYTSVIATLDATVIGG